MNQAESDDKISLRTYADQLCPDEAAALEGPKRTGLAAGRLSLDGRIAPNGQGLALAPTAPLVRSSLRAMVEAIVQAAVDGRSAILRDGVKLPASFFINERTEALALIEQALRQNDSRFQVRLSGWTLKSRAGGANKIDDRELLRKVEEGVQAGLSSRQSIILNLPPNITDQQQQDTIVSRVQRKRRKGSTS
jgi:hypothetical protein